MQRAGLVALLLMTSLFMAESALATTYEGCFVCEYEGLTGIGQICDQVGDGETGGGWSCRETYDLVGSKCQLEGGACYNVNVDGGGGGGGGGDDTCQERGPGGVCPAECFSCGGGGGGGVITV